ncbi:hypothetical protein BU23DRAFT_602119 [Bimuria novae-zelandiae CBS 107.79]|uniref:Uncharacterized protein n=1 Tax=Bimuria novae-zelandiae CBS 107.79 TaxID=1447943 RepID=A0A6A5V5B1_9PLEO|nr:hypothetical protein BU23DRAFT_602119 [Bimuria novae-zelandiae CBS 107.79]
MHKHRPNIVSRERYLANFVQLVSESFTDPRSSARRGIYQKRDHRRQGGSCELPREMYRNAEHLRYTNHHQPPRSSDESRTSDTSQNAGDHRGEGMARFPTENPLRQGVVREVASFPSPLALYQPVPLHHPATLEHQVSRLQIDSDVCENERDMDEEQEWEEVEVPKSEIERLKIQLREAYKMIIGLGLEIQEIKARINPQEWD